MKVWRVVNVLLLSSDDKQTRQLYCCEQRRMFYIWNKNVRNTSWIRTLRTGWFGNKRVDCFGMKMRGCWWGVLSGGSRKMMEVASLARVWENWEDSRPAEMMWRFGGCRQVDGWAGDVLMRNDPKKEQLDTESKNELWPWRVWAAEVKQHLVKEWWWDKV